MTVDFIQIQIFFIKLPSIECVSISSKFKGAFVKLTFKKSRGSFAKLSSMDCGLISPKFEGFFAKFTSPTIFSHWIGRSDGRGDLSYVATLWCKGIVGYHD